MREKIDVKKLINQLTLEMYEILFKEMGIPIYSKQKISGCCIQLAIIKTPSLVHPQSYTFILTQKFLYAIQGAIHLSIL